jgi:cytochrome c2
MAYRFPRAIVIALFLTLILTLPALAGGWAVITLDELPQQVDPNEPFSIGFMVRQHGIRPMEDLDPTITLWNRETGERFVAHAKPDGETGHYSAVFSFPSTGTWEWSIQAFSMDQPMPPLIVSAASQPSATITQDRSAPALLAGILGLAVMSAGLVLAFSRRSRWGYAMLAAGLLACLAGLVSVMRPSALAQSQAASPSALTSQQQFGRDLFTAKGCVTCHLNSRAVTNVNFSVEAGPNLTVYQANPEYLRTWLKDPKSIKPNTEMPDLGLKEVEIEALVAFLNANRKE